jgi:sarcosine oxidase subunit beta
MAQMLAQVIGVANADFAGRQEVNGRFRLTSGDGDWPHRLEEWEAEGGLVQPSGRSVVNTLSRAMHVVPGLATAKVDRVWGGLIDLTPDALPVIEREAGIDGLVVAAGFSGHGFCLGPVTGQIIRELVLTGESSFALDPFRRERLAGIHQREAVTLHG